MQVNRSLAGSTRRQTDAEPDAWEATYRQMVLFDLAADIELGFFLAYYRNFAVPDIAATLQQNGEIIARPMKRSYDTAIVTYELISHGLDSEQGRQMIKLLNRVHRHVPGNNDDFLYVLLTLLVVPIRWARAYAWRPPTPAEETAATRFYQELGARMNIATIPESFADAEKFFDHYERENIAYSHAGARLMSSTVQVLRSRLPRAARPLARVMLSAMFDDNRLAGALGLAHATQLSRAGLMATLKMRNAIHCRRPLKKEPYFVPGHAGSMLYPDGYRLDDIGPESVMTSTGRPDHDSL